MKQADIKRLEKAVELYKKIEVVLDKACDSIDNQPYNPKPKFKLCEICGNCGYFMRYVKYDGTPDNDGDCGSIGMNKECNDGKNPFNDENIYILQVDEKEKACGFFKVKRTERVRKYIKAHPDLYVQKQ